MSHDKPTYDAPAGRLLAGNGVASDSVHSRTCRPSMPCDFEIAPADAVDIRAVLRSCLWAARQTPAELERHVTAFLEYARAMSIELHRLWRVQRRGHVVAGAACIVSPGRTGMILLPNGRAPGVSAHLIRSLGLFVADAVLGDEVQLAQVLLDEDDAVACRALCDAGFRDIAMLHYMERSLDRPPMYIGASDRMSLGSLTWQSYSNESHGDFARTILDTYIGSLDCPTLSGLRHVDDIIEGHKSAGRFEPSRWHLLRVHGDPAGCILLAPNPLRPVLEIVYMGVRPAYRGRTLGALLLRTALTEAYHHGFQAVALAVDARNAPGRRLYDRFGFRETARRRAMLIARP